MTPSKKIALLNELLTENNTIQKIVERMAATHGKYVYVNIETSTVGVADIGNYVVEDIVSFGNCTPNEKGVIKRIREEIYEVEINA